ncbi:MAG: hypothetical protein RR488_01515 [Aurantimicrobium sp.]|uniref:hypothetical protein n=1 Tax=Aurantimicrobium sp. TaxID=1930784 RepID=UPI0030554D7C
MFRNHSKHRQSRIHGNVDWYFLTFGAGKFPMIRASKRLARQAKSTKMFVKTWSYGEKNLKRTGDNFWFENAEFIKSNPKGYGFWLWKPYIILKTLESIPDGSGLL